MQVPQLFGHIEFDDEQHRAMVCRDVDTPDELMVHYWGGMPNRGRAVRLAVGQAEDDGYRTASVLTAYATLDEGAGLTRVPVSSDFVEFLKSLTISVLVQEEQCTFKLQREGIISYGICKRNTKAPDTRVENLSSWSDFRQWANKIRQTENAELFRGHGDSRFSLTTTFHRNGRQDMVKYCDTVVPEFRSHAEAALGRRLDGDGYEFATLLALAQHHGLPTPLLDFTASPYIAAFFAFADALDQAREEATHVRIFAVTRAFLGSSTPPVVSLTGAWPFIYRLAVSPINNPRLYAQQGQFLATNVAMVEDFLEMWEFNTGKQAIYAADIPISETVKALEDLKYMGVTAATMFPGLDGACKMMKHDMFFRQQKAAL
ncbi:FRG domain-containing protein [Pseudoduganella lurida]|uniref:FRG domain-containing protein n=1 Tax=Pseudoduganella lurida TaxID=1036180 RepID=A0A562R7V7_9BURK|nr:FRG domain-containing protein [Pseudoduganella lurida]TWI65158.1 FRG domain-containing protein [Pseudoduganella lurida]